MRRMHRLSTALSASECAPLFEAAAAVGVRVGWLDLELDYEAAAAPAALEEAAALGAFRSVGVADRRVLAVKPVRGAPVLEDLLREYFSGCRLVLVRGLGGAPRLLNDPQGYRVGFESGEEKVFTAEALARAASKPRLGPLDAARAAVQSAAE